MQVGIFWVISMETLKGPWQVGSFENAWYIVNTETKKHKRMGPFRSRGTNYCDRAKEEAIRRNAALGFVQDDGKRANIVQVISEFSLCAPAELAAVCLYDRGIRYSDKPLSESDNIFVSNIFTFIQSIELDYFDKSRLSSIRMWLKRHSFQCERNS